MFTIDVFFDALIEFFSVPVVNYFLCILGLISVITVVYKNLWKGGF